MSLFTLVVSFPDRAEWSIAGTLPIPTAWRFQYRL
jgi:hypothetical protein